MLFKFIALPRVLNTFNLMKLVTGVSNSTQTTTQIEDFTAQKLLSKLIQNI